MKYLSIIICSIMIAIICSCSDDISTPNENENEVKDTEISEQSPEIKSNGEVCSLNSVNLASSMPDYIKFQIDARFPSVSTNINSSTKIVFASTAELISADQQLLEAYNQGVTLVFVDTDKRQLLQWLEQHEIEYAGEYEDFEDLHIIYALNNRDNFYFFDDFVDSESEEEIAYFPVRFDSFVDWMNKYASEDSEKAMMSPMTRAGDVYDIAKTFKRQVITHNFSVLLKDKELAKVVGSDSDLLTKTSSIDITFTIYPLYSKDENGSGGDYYIIEGYVNAHNGPMYAGKWTSRHGGVYARLCGFYMSELQVEAKLRTARKVQFPVGGTPVPQTTPSSTSYSSGFSWSIGGNICGKYEGGQPGAEIGISGSCSWNNSETRTLPDVSIKRDTKDSDIKWTYTFNNLPHTSGGSKYLNVPDLATSDFQADHTWIWWIPNTRNMTYLKDSYFTAEIKVIPTYQSYKWYSTAADFGTHNWTDGISSNDNTFRFTIKGPARSR